MGRSVATCAGILVGAALTGSASGGTISGQVTGPANQPLEDICVEVRNAASGEFSGFDFTNASGNYSVDDLDGGYRLYLSECTPFDPADRQWASEWYDDKRSFDEGDTVVVGASDDVSGIDVSLAEGGRIEGTVVRDLDGQPLGGICLFVIDPETNEFWYGDSAADGTYSIPGLAAGDYLVYFDPCLRNPRHTAECKNETAYQWEIYDDVHDESQATLVNVVTAAATTGIDGSLGLAQADLEVTALAVSNPGGGSTDPRQIEVTVTNRGTGSGRLDWVGVEVCGATVGCSQIGRKTLDLDAGEVVTNQFTWNPERTVTLGDVEIRAHAWLTNDPDCTNNEKRVNDWVRLEDTGVGVSLLDQPESD